ncbi:LamG domain-containing protein [Sphingobacterium kitahiroshimense]|uniref:LamG-like jellyroll fold domain-containing protein n=1 Tax=Sphingobacterium sp. B16(2022) TaxID=2914044 RepID=UPI00143A29CD|nr:LamG-like jellyroll fold domain-containing protein [Sphingobacterium sp. B16(2022)]NJI73937.1 LamG domain-containing protein [Sphingobacterium sp. B16(2022)]
MKRIQILLFFIILHHALQAKVKPLGHFNFGKVGNVTYAIGPEKVKSRQGNFTLTRIDRPLFYADAPAEKAQQGEGAILFNGKTDGYSMSSGIGVATENFVFEVWVKAKEIDSQSGEMNIVALNGTTKEGYGFAQRGKSWVFISADKGTTSIGNAVKGQWIHLAATLRNGVGELWMNGKKTGSFNATKTIAPHFSIAISNEGKQAFMGEVYEVRWSTFEKQGFDEESDFLINYKKKKERDRSRDLSRLTLMKNIQKPGLGKSVVSEFENKSYGIDWLIAPVKHATNLYIKENKDNKTAQFQLNNGLVSRTFYVADNLACIGYKNLSNQAEYVRAVKPEARVMLDSIWYEVGGLKGQPEKSYLMESWLYEMETDDQAFELVSIETAAPLERYPWQQKYNAVATDWPVKGLRLILTFKPTERMDMVKNIEVKVNYEIYQGLPVITKWVEVLNNSDNLIRLNQIETEVLAVNQDQINRIHVESDFSFALVNANLKGSALMHYQGDKIEAYQAGESTTKWVVDQEYNTWATHNQAEDGFLDFPHRNLLVSHLPMGPDVDISNKESFKSYLTFELLQDADDRERKSLAHRRMYKKLAPQTTESLITGGITSHDEKTLKNFIDQMGELGMERLDIQAWPGISHDNLDDKYVALWKDIASYAKGKGIVMGGYELQVASRGRGAEVDCVHPVTGKPGSLFGQSVCIASAWKDTYYKKMWDFYDKTGLKSYTIDGPYHGDPCASTVHPHHHGLYDSQWEQWKSQVAVLHEAQRRNMYAAIPDWYFLNGQSATGMGYREASANLTPDQQMLLGRQYIYDGTWHKLPTMGWIGMQLVGFYSNDPKIGLEPLAQNLDRYERQLMQFLASGSQFTIRGNRLYDTPETKAMVSKKINWFKKHREILTSEIIHVSRPNGRDLDCMLHVNPFINEKGMVIFFNPTDKTIKKELRLPLYYTGIKGKAMFTNEEGITTTKALDDKADIEMTVEVKPGGTAWYVIEDAQKK